MAGRFYTLCRVRSASTSTYFTLTGHWSHRKYYTVQAVVCNQNATKLLRAGLCFSSFFLQVRCLLRFLPCCLRVTDYFLFSTYLHPAASKREDIIVSNPRTKKERCCCACAALHKFYVESFGIDSGSRVVLVFGNVEKLPNPRSLPIGHTTHQQKANSLFCKVAAAGCQTKSRRTLHTQLCCSVRPKTYTLVNQRRRRRQTNKQTNAYTQSLVVLFAHHFLFHPHPCTFAPSRPIEWHCRY